MRINIIPVKLLADQHLVAEYREIKMLPKALCRSIRSKIGVDFDSLPSTYTLNVGHGKFFYNKLDFIEYRFEELLEEMKIRNFTTNNTELYDVDYDYSCIDRRCYSDEYIPTIGDMFINIDRILLRIKEKEDTKPNFYKYYSQNKTYLDFCDIYAM